MSAGVEEQQGSTGLDDALEEALEEAREEAERILTRYLGRGIGDFILVFSVQKTKDGGYTLMVDLEARSGRLKSMELDFILEEAVRVARRRFEEVLGYKRRRRATGSEDT